MIVTFVVLITDMVSCAANLKVYKDPAFIVGSKQ